MDLLLIVSLFLYICSLNGTKTSCFTKDKVQFLKAILPILIVGHHLSFLPVLSQLSAWGSPVVAVFLCISGYGLQKSYQKQGDSYLNSFFSKRIFSVILPCLVATIFYKYIFYPSDRSWISIFQDLFVHGIAPLPYSWYVYTIVVLYVFFYITYKYFSENWRVLFINLEIVFYVLVTYALGYEKFWYLTSLAFPVGIIYAKYEDRILTYIENKKTYACFMFFVMVLMGALISMQNTYCDFLYFMWLPLVLILFFSRLNVAQFNGKIIHFISQISYEIYLVQGFAIFYLRKQITQDYLYIICVYLAIFLLAFLLQKMVLTIKKMVNFV